MGTRAAAFTAKIHNLQHYSGRIKHNLLPLPSGDDVANTLRYFSQTLLGVLKDVPSISFDMLRSPEQDPVRTSLFPSLDYKTLYHALVGLVDAVPLVQHGAHALGYNILHTFSCLVPFLEHDLMDTLPYLVASTMTIFPCSLHKDIVDTLCNHLLPFTFRTNQKESYASTSTVSILMMVFQYTDCTAFHCQVLECFMGLKNDIAKDLLCVIGHGTAKSRCHAVELLFQYLPTLNPALLDGKGIGWLLDSLCTLTCLVLFPTFSPSSSVSPSLMPQGSGHTGWKPRSCQREACTNMSSNEAVKMCFDHSASGDHPPPLYLCEDCATEIEQELGPENLVDVLLPMDKVSATCEEPECKSTDKSAVATCFSIQCARRNHHRPIRYCSTCVLTHHNEEMGSDHLLHTTIPSPWSMDPETQSYMVEAVVSLLHEAEPQNPKQDSSNGVEEEVSRETSVVEERQLLSKYGIWLLVGLCTPNEHTPPESLGRLLSMLFQWFHYTACLPDVPELSALERLKKEYIHGWLMEVAQSHFEVFVSCLLPHPVDYVKVGGHWESWPSYPVQIKEGFKRLICLAPYDVLTLEVWEYIMPYWMDALRHEAVESEFNELKILLSKVLDPDLSPLAFTADQMYMFLIKRFKSSSAPIQEQALYWVQILSMLEVPVPLELLYSMFTDGVEASRGTCPGGFALIPPPTLRTRPPVEEEHSLLDVEYKTDAEVDLPCYILMLDILIKQLELHDLNMHKGVDSSDAQNILRLIRLMLEGPWEGRHTCVDSAEGSQCAFCEICAIFFQLSLTLIEFFSPVMEVSMADVPTETIPPPETGDEATVQECTAPQDTTSPVAAVANDEASAKGAVASEDRQTAEEKSIEKLPPQLQLFYVLLKDLAVFEDADVLYHILACLKVMCLHSEVLNKAAHQHRPFLIWCQENILVINLWKLLQMEFSHIAQLATSLLLHSITLLSGFETFWKILETDFHSKEWRARFAAVEKVTVIAHFVDSICVKNSPLMQSALAGSFCYLVHSLDDEQPTISERTLLNLESIKTPSLKLFVWCLEVQFDSNITDRPMILQTIFQIQNHLTHKRFLTWDFFLNRFDTLFLEDQLTLDDISYVRDLKNSNINSEMFQKKLKRAQESLAHTTAPRSLTLSFGGKMPYKRAMSAPSPRMARQDRIDRDKLYERQSSAPVLKRKSSRLIGSGPLPHFPNSFFTDGHLKDQLQEESHVLNVLYRAMDVEEHDKETLPLLIFLLMQFLSRPDPIHRTDDKITRSQHIVLRHLNILLGYSYNQGEGRFLLPPHKVRSSAIFTTFLMGMPKVLDYNFEMGSYLLTTFLTILVCCPSPQKYPNEHYPPSYSLWALDTFCRHSWLQSTLVILYKYHYDTFPPNRYIQWLIVIVLNTLKTQRHRCKQVHEPLLSPLPSRSRDVSTPSADMEHSVEDTSSVHEDNKPFKSRAKFSSPEHENKEKWKSWKSSERSYSSDGEDAEPELEAIPESPKSESFELDLFPFPGEDSPWPKMADKEEVCPLEVVSSDDVVEKSSVEAMEKHQSQSVLTDQSQALFLKESDDIAPEIECSNKKDKGDVKRVLTRMQSLPFESRLHQSVCRSKTDSNILDLPPNDDKPHSRYPPPRRRKAEILGSDNLTVPITRPPLERLLPIGLPDRPKRSDTLPSPSSRDLCEDKGVQTGDVGSLIHIPTPERLLPVGLLPARKDWYPHRATQDDAKSNEPITIVHSEVKTILKQDWYPHRATQDEAKSNDPFPIVHSEVPKTVPKQDWRPRRATQDEAKSNEPLPIAHPEVPKTVSKQDWHPHRATQDEAKSNEPLPIAHPEVPKTVPKQDWYPHRATQDEAKSNEPHPIVRPEIPKTASKQEKPTAEERSESAIGALAGGNFINKLFDLTPELPGSAFGVFDICRNAMDLRSEDEPKKNSKELHNSCLETSEKIELQTFIPHDLPSKSSDKGSEEDIKSRLPFKQRKQRKTTLTALEAQRSLDYPNPGQRRRRVEKKSDMVVERCTECGAVMEEYSDEEIGLCIVILATFVHREPAMASPLLPKMLRVVSRIASSPNYPWQGESNIYLPGGSVSVARQFLRCTLHQLAPNGIFVQIFQSHIIEPEFYRTMASALADFNEVNQVTPLVLLLENLNDKKHLNHETTFHILENVAVYVECLPLDTSLPQWGVFLHQLETFLRNLNLPPGPVHLQSLLRIILSALKLPIIREAKSILDPFSKILSHSIQHSSLDYHLLSELCTVCNRNVRDRDKLLLTRTAVFELIQALKFKTSLPDANLLILVQFVLADFGGRLSPTILLDFSVESQNSYKTMAGECMQQYLNDALEFVSDIHTLTKVKNTLYGNSTHLNEETLGGHLKAGLAQFLAIEFSKNNGRDNRAINRYLPWLYHPPTILQQGPKEFMDCVSHIRLLSWLLLGALVHSALLQTPSACQPIPLEANTHIAEHIQVILAGFSEQSKVSVLHMSSLFHAFILCQLWTMYCEHMVALNPPGSEQNQVCGLTLTDFWAKVTPGILQLVCQSKLAEMVSLHFLSLMEALEECNSTILARLLPMWIPVLYSFQGHLSSSLQMRLEACVSCAPPTREDTTAHSTAFLRWLQRLHFKMAQIELQSSTATQFYSL